jgi:hypothetical protein
MMMISVCGGRSHRSNTTKFASPWYSSSLRIVHWTTMAGPAVRYHHHCCCLSMVMGDGVVLLLEFCVVAFAPRRHHLHQQRLACFRFRSALALPRGRFRTRGEKEEREMKKTSDNEINLPNEQRSRMSQSGRSIKASTKESAREVSTPRHESKDKIPWHSGQPLGERKH